MNGLVPHQVGCGSCGEIDNRFNKVPWAIAPNKHTLGNFYIEEYQLITPISKTRLNIIQLGFICDKSVMI